MHWNSAVNKSERQKVRPLDACLLHQGRRKLKALREGKTGRLCLSNNAPGGPAWEDQPSQQYSCEVYRYPYQFVG